VSFALSAENTAPLNLSPAEQEVFSTWGLAHEYCGIVTSPSLPINGSLVNIPSAAVPADYLAFPTPPFVVRYQFLGDTNFRILLTGTENYTLPLARQLTNNTFGALQSAGDIPQGADLTIRALEEHTTTKQAILRRRFRMGFMGSCISCRDSGARFIRDARGRDSLRLFFGSLMISGCCLGCWLVSSGWKKLTDAIKGKIINSDKMRYYQAVLKMNIACSCSQAVVKQNVKLQHNSVINYSHDK
jgi:hypothetical protein